jgi:hypothetical protein
MILAQLSTDDILLCARLRRTRRTLAFRRAKFLFIGVHLSRLTRHLSDESEPLRIVGWGEGGFLKFAQKQRRSYQCQLNCGCELRIQFANNQPLR